jgi:hypothetical protein
MSIFIRNDLTYSPLTVSQSGKEKMLEPCALQISIGETDITVSFIYRSPSGNFKQFLNLLDCILQQLYKPKTEFVISDDLNVNVLTESNHYHN